MGGVYTETVAVSSSNLKAAGWTLYNGMFPLLEVEFLSNRLYLYERVPESVYTSLMAAPSKGKYFYYNIREGTPYVYHRLR